MPDYELYAGFLLLNYNAEIPPELAVREPNLPRFCAVEDATEPTAQIEKFASSQELQAQVFYPIFTVANKPAEIRSEECELVKNKQVGTGDADAIYACSIGFNSDRSAESGFTNQPIRLLIERQYAKPYPIWKPNPRVEWGAETRIEKVDSLPSPGVAITYPNGKSYQWIAYDVLYTLFVEDAGFIPEFVLIDPIKAEGWQQ